MDLATIEAPVEQAKAKLEEYRAGIKAENDATDAMILKGYEALAEGKSLIRLPQTIEAGGWDDNQLPRLAIARMTDLRIQVRFHDEQTIFYPATMRSSWNGPYNERSGLNAGVVRVPAARPPQPAGVQNRRPISAEAIVPLVPPALRPKLARQRYFVLFEAEWNLVPPYDPALIRHLVGDLWIVLSTWDLTELERAAIAGR